MAAESLASHCWRPCLAYCYSSACCQSSAGLAGEPGTGSSAAAAAAAGSGAASSQATGTALRLYGVSLALQVCEADNTVCRINEELALLVKEMHAHIKYWQALIDKQQRFISVLESALDPHSDVQQLCPAVADLYQVGCPCQGQQLSA